MSWHASGLIVHVATPERGYAKFLKSLDVGEPAFDRAASLDEAVREDGVAVASVDGWTTAWGQLLIVPDDALARLTRTADALVFLMEGASDSYLFEWWSEGVRKRKWFAQDGDIVIDEGKPLPGEKAIFRDAKDSEDRIFALMAKLTLPYARLAEATYHVFRVEE